MLGLLATVGHAASPYRQPVAFTAGVDFGNSVFVVGNGRFDNPPGGGNYLTGLDVFHMQDGNVFPYRPFSFPTLFGFAYALERSTDLRVWTGVAATPPEYLPWGRRTLEDPAVPGSNGRAFWRLAHSVQP